MIVLLFPVSIPSKMSIYNYIEISNIKELGEEKYDFITTLQKQTIQTEALKENLDKRIINSNKLNKSYFKEILADIWFVIFLHNMIKVICSYRLLAKGIGNDEVKDERIVKILEKCKKRLKIKKNIRIIRQDLLKMPAMTGLIDVKILLTDVALELDDIALTDVIMHELSHYKRKDNIVNFIIMILKALHWFNPCIKRMFQFMKMDMELATDEMAIHHINEKEKSEYCKVIIKVATMYTLKEEQVLGLSSDIKEIEQRIDMIALKEDFEKYTIPIFTFTFGIILLIWLLLYPSSYAVFETPKLYLELENGSKIEAVKPKETNLPTVRIKKEGGIKLILEEGKCKKYIFYNKTNLNDMTSEEGVVNMAKGISYLEVGEYRYQFTINHGKDQNIDYAVRIIVE